jgi:predicted 3-demethylubiquinone-9 3-methyltransferase (glyoxalase superfamily)
VDYYWEKLAEGGDPTAQQCGWLKDKFGASWQVAPRVLMEEMLNHPDKAKSERAFEAMLQMKKLDIAGLRRAFDG